MTQAQRVLLALRRAGDRGSTAHDFYATPVDNGPRISRVAARVLDLRAQGHVIVPAGERDGHRVYVLVGAGVAPSEAKGVVPCEQAGSAPVDSAGALSVRPAASPQPSPSSSPGSASGAAPTTPAHPPAVPAPLHRSVLPRTPSSRTAPESPGKPDAAASGEPGTLFDTTALRRRVTGTDLIRPLSSVAWELRAAWATGRRVAVSVDGHGRVEGHVSHVAATDAFAVVRGTLVPLGLVLAVHHPSRLGDSTARAGQWEGPAHAPAHHPGQQQFEEWGIDPESGQPTPIEENV